MLPHVYAANSVEPLTDKQEKFVREYLIDQCATRAARRAGYSMKSARDIGCENLTKPNILRRIDALRAQYSQQAEVSAVKVLTEMSFLAFSDMREIGYAEDGTVDWDETTFQVARAMQVHDVERTDTKDGQRIKTKLKLYDKRSALVTLMQHLGLVSAELPPIEVLFNRLPKPVADMMRRVISASPEERAEMDRRAAQETQSVPMPSIIG